MNITPDELKQLHALRAHAEAHPFSEEDIQGMFAGIISAPPLRPEFRIELTSGRRVVYALMSVGKKVIRQLQVTDDAIGMSRMDPMLEVLLREFGFASYIGSKGLKVLEMSRNHIDLIEDYDD